MSRIELLESKIEDMEKKGVRLYVRRLRYRKAVPLRNVYK